MSGAGEDRPTEGPTEGPAEGPEDEWRRLDRRMLLVHPVQTVIQAFPALIAIFVVSSTSDSSSRWELLALPVVVAYGLLRWFTTRFRLDTEQIEVRRGVVAKQSTTARLDKVRTVDLTAQVWHRMLGLAKVEISTAGSTERLVLDSLSRSAAGALRAELLHRAAVEDVAGVRGVAGAETGAAQATGLSPADSSWAAPTGLPVMAPATDEELLRLEPGWVRYAPFTMSGFLSAAALLGVGSQIANQFSAEGEVYSSTAEWAVDHGVVTAVLIVLAAVTALSVIGYVLSFAGFALTRSRLGSLHTRRGLLTHRETSIDSGRLRGVAVGEPLGLRVARGRRLKAVSTGLAHQGGGGSDWLAPPAPAQTVDDLAVTITDDGEAIRGELLQHGPTARRRRLTRAVAPALVLLGGALVARAAWDLPVWVVAVVAVLVPVAVAVGLDRYAGLGHLLTPAHLVVRSGSLDRTRVALQRSGIIGWTLRQSFFQRRAGVATLVATTAAGQQHYDIVDVAPERAHVLIGEVTPDLLHAFARPAP